MIRNRMTRIDHSVRRSVAVPHSAFRVPRSSQGGFTVLEVLITFGVLAVGFSSIVALIARGTANHRAAVDTTQAAALAASVLDDVGNGFFGLYRDANGNGTPDVWEDSNGNGVQDRFERLSGPVPPADLMPNARHYDFSLEYKYSGTNQREVFVFCKVYWRDKDDLFQDTFRRVIFLKRDAKP